MMGTQINKRRAMRIMLWTGFWVFLLDQGTKFFVVHWLDLLVRERIAVWSPFLEFRMAWNRGVNFGLFAGQDPRWFLVAVAVAIVGFVLWWVPRDSGGFWSKFAAGLLIGGAVGNIVDRLLYGAVADFLNMSCCGFDNPYAFNIADIAIFAGALGLALLSGDRKGGGAARRSKGDKTP